MFVKICGVTSEEDALLAVAMGADAVGFVLAPSPRQMRPDTVRDIVRRLPPETLTVGVFRHERPGRVCEVVNRVGLRAAQLHGGEPLREVEYVRERVPVLIQALSAGDDRLREAGASPADVILVDSPDPGSGTVFDWALVEGAPGGIRLLLAGGLTPDNVETAIRRVRPWGVDVSSGVEREPGRKDPTRVRLFVERARATAEALAEEEGWVPVDDPPFDWEVDL